MYKTFDQLPEKYILIQPMLFGDLVVNVWQGTTSLLDREYFVRGPGAAIFTATNVKKDLFPDLPIFVINPDGKTYQKYVGI